jgi:hypothetical protein
MDTGATARLRRLFATRLKPAMSLERMLKLARSIEIVTAAS